MVVYKRCCGEVSLVISGVAVEDGAIAVGVAEVSAALGVAVAVEVDLAVDLAVAAASVAVALGGAGRSERIGPIGPIITSETLWSKQ